MVCEKSFITIKLIWHGYLVLSLSICAHKTPTETSFIGACAFYLDNYILVTHLFFHGLFFCTGVVFSLQLGLSPFLRVVWLLDFF